LDSRYLISRPQTQSHLSSQLGLANRVRGGDEEAGAEGGEGGAEEAEEDVSDEILAHRAKMAEPLMFDSTFLDANKAVFVTRYRNLAQASDKSAQLKVSAHKALSCGSCGTLVLIAN
jgi:hypothetical protein